VIDRKQKAGELPLEAAEKEGKRVNNEMQILKNLSLIRDINDSKRKALNTVKRKVTSTLGEHQEVFLCNFLRVSSELQLHLIGNDLKNGETAFEIEDGVPHREQLKEIGNALLKMRDKFNFFQAIASK